MRSTEGVREEGRERGGEGEERRRQVYRCRGRRGAAGCQARDVSGATIAPSGRVRRGTRCNSKLGDTVTSRGRGRGDVLRGKGRSVNIREAVGVLT